MSMIHGLSIKSNKKFQEWEETKREIRCIIEAMSGACIPRAFSAKEQGGEYETDGSMADDGDVGLFLLRGGADAERGVL